jgi:hypothetical protein
MVVQVMVNHVLVQLLHAVINAVIIPNPVNVAVQVVRLVLIAVEEDVSTLLLIAEEYVVKLELQQQ